MPVPVIPPDTRVFGSGNPPADVNALADCVGLIASVLAGLGGQPGNTYPAGNAASMTAVAAMQSGSVVGAGLTPTGVDDTANIKALLLLTGGCVLGAGTFYYSATLTLTGTGPRLLGQGWGLTTLQALAGFTFDGSGAMINVTGAHPEIAHFQHIGGPSASFGSNPAGNGIQIQPGAQYCKIHDLGIYYQNGYEIEYVGGATSANIVGTMFWNLQRFQNSKGIHLKGSSASSWNGQVQIYSIQAGQLSGNSLFLEDIQDIAVYGYNDSIVGGSAATSALKIAGACSAIRVYAADLGQFPNTGGNTPTNPTVLITDTANGAPNDVDIYGVIQQGGPTGGVLISNPNGGSIQRVHIYARIAQCQGHGASVTATSGFDIAFYDSKFSGNGQASGTFQEVSWTGGASGKVKRSHFATAQGSGGGGAVANVADFTGAGQVEFDDNEIAGSGFTAANVFGQPPKFGRRNKGYNNIIGSVAITVPASGSATAGRHFDMWQDWTAAPSAPCALTGAGAPTRTFATGSTNSNTTIGDTGGSFTPADVGKMITGTNIPSSPVTFITAVASSTSATISQAATGTGTSLSFTVKGIGIAGGVSKQVYVPAGLQYTPNYNTAPGLTSAGL